jgi:hypothetical protein
MKTKVEVLGYEIEIEEVDGVVTVKAELDGEVVEEFTLESEEGQMEDDEDIKGFKDFDGQDEEEDFDGQMQGQMQGQMEDDEDFEGDDEEESKLESFQSFVNRSKK